MTEILGSVVSTLNDNVRWDLRMAGEEALEDVLDTSSISGLGIEGRAGHVGNHSISSSTDILHIAPSMITGSGLGEPDITSVSTQLTRLEGRSNIYC
jgi:hypothetical protein